MTSVPLDAVPVVQRSHLDLAKSAVRQAGAVARDVGKIEVAHDLLGVPSLFAFDVSDQTCERQELWIAVFTAGVGIHTWQQSATEESDSDIEAHLLTEFPVHLVPRVGCATPLYIGVPRAASRIRSDFYQILGDEATAIVFARRSAQKVFTQYLVGYGYGPIEEALAEQSIDCSTLPLADSFRVIWGGRNVCDNHHFPHRIQRYAVDLEPIDLRQRPVVLSPVAGTIARVTDKYADNAAYRPPRYEDPEGNSVVISFGEIEIHLCHLKRGSTLVREGQSVLPGSPIGRLGNSGNSSIPHLHIHAQQAKPPFHGLPLSFAGAELSRGQSFHR